MARRGRVVRHPLLAPSRRVSGSLPGAVTLNSIPYFRYRNLVSPVRGGSLGDPLKLPKCPLYRISIENFLEKFLEPNVRLITSLVGPQLTIAMLVTLNPGAVTAISGGFDGTYTYFASYDYLLSLQS